MNHSHAVRARRSPVRTAASLILAFSGVFAAPRAVADDYPGTIVRVEEDWEYCVTDATDALAEVTCAISPVSGQGGDYVTFELNHQSQPGYIRGGLHLNVWQGEATVGLVSAQPEVIQSTPSEVVSWTQSMALSDGTLTYEVTNGTSTTWGTFGTGELKVTVPSQLSDLNGYSVNDSISGLVLATDGVAHLRLKSVRLYAATGEVYEISVNHDVLEHPES